MGLRRVKREAGFAGARLGVQAKPALSRKK
jgi:hypothetical protein